MSASELVRRQLQAGANQWRDDDELLEIPLEQPLPCPELQALQDAHKAIKSRLPFDELNQFVGLPNWVRVTPTGSTKGGTSKPNSKWPIETNWQALDGPKYTPMELLQTNGYVRQNTIGTGVLTGEKGNGLILVDFDEPVDPKYAGYSQQTFREVMGKPASALPPSPQITSGKAGRYKTLLRVPLEWWDSLSGWSTQVGEYEPGMKALEIIWECNFDKCKHGTILGEHPQSTEEQPLIYRWMEGFSPADLPIADAPVWMLARCVQLRAIKNAPKPTAEMVVADGEAKPFDLLTPKLQLKVLNEILAKPYLPIRCKEHSGTYETLRHAVAGMVNYWGVDNAISIFSGTTWDKQNDYAYNGVVSLERWCKSLAKTDNKTQDVGAILKIAQENGWEFPEWAKPPRDVDHSLMGKTIADVKFFRNAWEDFKLLENPVDRSMGMSRLQKHLGLSSKEMAGLMKDLFTEDNPENEQLSSVELVMATDFKTQHTVEGLVAAGCLTCLGAATNSGKSTYLYALAEAVTNGEPFLGVFPTDQGAVIFIQADEPPSDAKKKWQRMGFNPARGQMKLIWNWTPSQMPELEEQIKSMGAKVVVMDSLGKLFGGNGSSMNDAEIGFPLYELNKIASRTGASIILTHHLKKPQTDNNGNIKPVTLNDFYGSSYILNAVSDVWGLWREAADGPNGEMAFSMKYLKQRSMLQEAGFTLRLQGSDESLRFNVDESGEGGLKELEGKQNLRKQLISQLKKASDKWHLVEELQQHVGASNTPRSVRRALGELHQDAAASGVERRPVSGSASRKGRPSYEYRYVR